MGTNVGGSMRMHMRSSQCVYENQCLCFILKFQVTAFTEGCQQSLIKLLPDATSSEEILGHIT